MWFSIIRAVRLCLGLNRFSWVSFHARTLIAFPFHSFSHIAACEALDPCKYIGVNALITTPQYSLQSTAQVSVQLKCNETPCPLSNYKGALLKRSQEY